LNLFLKAVEIFEGSAASTYMKSIGRMNQNQELLGLLALLESVGVEGYAVK